jgi:hypothetical protein
MILLTRESLVSDIPAGDGQIFFFTVYDSSPCGHVQSGGGACGTCRRRLRRMTACGRPRRTAARSETRTGRTHGFLHLVMNSRMQVTNKKVNINVQKEHSKVYVDTLFCTVFIVQYVYICRVKETYDDGASMLKIV